MRRPRSQKYPSKLSTECCSCFFRRMHESDPPMRKSEKLRFRPRPFAGNAASTQGVLVQAPQGLAARRFSRGVCVYCFCCAKLGCSAPFANLLQLRQVRTMKFRWLFRAKLTHLVKDGRAPRSLQVGCSRSICSENPNVPSAIM